MTSPCILITGANRGIGLEFCRQFAQDEWRVLACCRNPDQAEELHLLCQNHPAIELHALDVTDYVKMNALSDQLRDSPVDIVHGSKSSDDVTRCCHDLP